MAALNRVQRTGNSVTREMPGEVVAELIDRTLAARHGGIEPSVAESWKAETDRHIAEIEAGSVKGVPLKESLARAQNRRPVIHAVMHMKRRPGYWRERL
jgi:hypothetical protein